MAGLYRLIVKIFVDNGKLVDLTYCLSAVVAPCSLLGCMIGLISLPFSQIPSALFIPGLISMVLGIYMLVLYILILLQ